MTRTDAQIAREWAEGFIKHAATAQIVDAGELAAARHVLATTTPPTMADIAWDDEAHHLAEATAAWSEGYPSTVIMLNKFGKKIVVYQPSSHYSGVRELNPGILTPTGRKYRLDMTPLSEPAEDTPEPEQPRSEDVKPDPQPGEAWLIEYEGERYEAIYWYSAWLFVYDWEGTVSIESHEATPVSRLVGEAVPSHPAVLVTEEDYENAPEGTIVASDLSDPWVKDSMGFWLVCGEGGGEISRLMALSSRRVLRWGETL